MEFFLNPNKTATIIKVPTSRAHKFSRDHHLDPESKTPLSPGPIYLPLPGPIAFNISRFLREILIVNDSLSLSLHMDISPYDRECCYYKSSRSRLSRFFFRVLLRNTWEQDDWPCRRHFFPSIRPHLSDGQFWMSFFLSRHQDRTFFTSKVDSNAT